jgi:thiamine biosynthesis lipoprotein
MERHGFRAMGTDLEVLLDVEPGADALLGLASVEREFRRLEAIMTRFDEESELCRLNTEGSIEPSPDLRAVVELALEARDRTGGRFDPTIHDALVAAGYDRSFELIGDELVAGRPTAAAGGRVHVGPALIALEPGVRLDLGGIGKGYAVDRAVALLAPHGPCLVNAGGDLAVSGIPEQGTWPVGVETSDGSLTLGLTSGALATSGTDRRRWKTANGAGHHLIDPRSGRPSESDLLRVTVIASTAIEAEVLAKALFLAGEQDAVAEAEALGAPAVIVTADGRTRLVGGLE